MQNFLLLEEETAKEPTGDISEEDTGIRVDFLRLYLRQRTTDTTAEEEKYLGKIIREAGKGYADLVLSFPVVDRTRQGLPSYPVDVRNDVCDLDGESNTSEYMSRINRVAAYLRDLYNRVKEPTRDDRRDEELDLLIGENFDIFSDRVERMDEVSKEYSDARKRLAEGNRGLVFSIAKKYNRHSKLGLFDLIQEGQIGLMKAVDNFDPYKINPTTGKPYRFSTYATWIIRKEISRAVRGDRIIEVPTDQIPKITKIRKAEKSIVGEGEKPTIDLLASRTGMKIGEIKLLRRYSTSEGSYIGSLDGEVVENLGDKGDWKDPIDTSSLRESIRRGLSQLNTRAQLVITRRFGLDGSDPETCPEIARRLDGISPQRVQQIEKESLRRLSELSHFQKMIA